MACEIVTIPVEWQFFKRFVYDIYNVANQFKYTIPHQIDLVIYIIYAHFTLNINNFTCNLPKIYKILQKVKLLLF